VFVSVKHNQKEKKNMLTLGREPIYFASVEYCHHALTRSATSGCDKQPPLRNVHLS